MASTRQPFRHVDPAKLTSREPEVYALYRQGLSAEEICAQLGISQGSVSHRLTIAKEKARAQ
jgi:DNA-binding CsgD family transcriptional regulator